MKNIRRAVQSRLSKLLGVQSQESIEKALILAAKKLQWHLQSPKILSEIADSEYKVFSQWGEDGIIQYLLSKVELNSDYFVEFGVEDYRESNTRYLLLNNNWSGTVIDGSKENIERIKGSYYFWMHELTAVHGFVTKENINQILRDSGVPYNIGILSVDIDGNDYWVWNAITDFDPTIVICEYNSLFGCDLPVSIPYIPEFFRTETHASNLYFGASISSLCHLAYNRGYDFVGTNSVGTNAFFVKSCRNKGLRALTPEEGYRSAKIRESRDVDGKMTHLAGDDRLKAIGDLELVNVKTGDLLQVKDLPEY